MCFDVGGREVFACGCERRRFDVIFVDPPFSEEWLTRLWPQLDAHASASGWVYIEQGQPIDAPPGWELHRQRQAGQVHYHLLRRSGR